MSFNQREEFFLPGRSAEQARLDGWSELLAKGLLGLAIGSMWWWIDASAPSSDIQPVYQLGVLLSPLIGLALIVWAIVLARRNFHEATLPVVDKLAYVLDPKGIQLHYSGAPAMMPWETLSDVTSNPKHPEQLTLVHRPEGSKANERRVINGGAHSLAGATLAERLPKWRDAMAAGGAR